MKWLTLLVPVAIGLSYLFPDRPILVFVAAVLSLIPLAAFMGESTEHVAAHVGQSIGGLLNATFGNMAELIIMIAMLREGLHEIVLAGILGGILVNGLLASGLSMTIGGFKHHIQTYNRESSRDAATLLTMAVFGLAVISVISMRQTTEVAQMMPESSTVVSVLLLLGYAMYLFYSMKTHKDLFESPRSEEDEDTWSLKKALAILTVVTLFVVWVSEILSGAVEEVVATAGLSELFVGAVVIAVIGGAAEIASAMRAANKGRLDLALAISMGGSVQIALFVAPVLVFASYFIGERPLELVFKGPAVILLFFSVVIVSQLSSDGRSTWFKGALMVLAYVILAAGVYLVG